MSWGAEDRIHQWLRQKLRQGEFDRLGDDGAILPAGGPWAVTQDHQIQGVHFPSGLNPTWIARRLLAVNLSDLAAMGAEPAFAFLALSCPSDFDIQDFLSAFVRACGRHELELAGGDLAGNDKVTASLTLLGKRTSGGNWLRRKNARPGDALWLAGDLGLSAVGRKLLDHGAGFQGRRVQLPANLVLTSREEILAKQAVRRHLIPRPQLATGRWLAARRRVAAIDVSDGLALDLHRLCRESRVGALISERGLSAGGYFSRLCRKLGLEPVATILSGGEDYALLFTLSPRVRPPEALSCRKIGRIEEGSGVLLGTEDGATPIPATGWDHFTSATEA